MGLWFKEECFGWVQGVGVRVQGGEGGGGGGRGGVLGFFFWDGVV